MVISRVMFFSLIVFLNANFSHIDDFFYTCRCNHHAADKKHECATCPQKFGTRHDLNRHIKNVHEEKRLVCPDCTKCFADPGAYDDHKAGHTGENPHICQCGKAYVYATGLSRHKRKCRK